MADRTRNAETAGGNVGWNLRLQALPSHGLTIAAAIAALVLLVNVSLNRRNTRQLADQGGAVIYSYQVITHLAEVMSLAKDAEASTRGFVITGDPTFLSAYSTAVRELPKELTALDSLIGRDPVQAARMPVLHSRVDARMEWLRETARVRIEQGLAAGEARVRTGEGKAKMDALREVVSEMRLREDSLLRGRTEGATSAYDQVLRSGLLAALGAFLAFVALALLVYRHMRARAVAHEETLEQRAYFENTLRSIDDTVITTDEKGLVSGLNDAAVRMTGWTEGEASGRSLKDVLVMHSVTGEVLSDGSMPTNPGTSAPLVVVETRRGGERLAQLRRSTIRTGDRTPVGSVVVLADVTDSLDAKARLAQADYRLRSALQAAGMLAWEYDIRSDRFTVSENATAILGLVDGQRLDGVASALAICHPADIESLRQAVAVTMASGERLETESRIVRPSDGVMRWMQVRADVLRDEQDAPVRLAGMLLDITDRRLAQDDVVRLSSLMHAINEATPDYVYTKDLRGQLTYANAAVCTGLGMPLEAVLGKTDLEFQSNPDHALAIMANDRMVMDSGKPQMIDEVLDLPSGRRWFYSAKLPQLDANGKVVGLIGVSRDITDRKRDEAALLESEGRFRSLADSAPVMIWLSDPLGDITYANAQWMSFVGADPEKPIDIAGALHPDDRPQFEQMLAQLRTQKGPLTLELRLCRADTRYRWVLCTAMPRLSEAGSFLGGIGSLLDIEERKALEDDLRVLAADLSAADRRKDEFIATLAHELRNPLAPIRNGLEILRLALPPNDTIIRTRGMMERQLEQIVRLVDDLLDIGRISSGKLSLQRARIDLRDALALAIEATAAKRTTRSQRLIWEPPPNEVIVDGDLVRLGQVFTNLLDNASKYSPERGLIWLSLHADETSVEVRVRDRGEGIPSTMLHEVFEMFAQVDRSLERTQGGLGIGLTLVKRLVEMHGGTVVAHSEGPQHGSEFSVRLPLVSDVSRVLFDGEAPEQVTENAAHTILIADDNEDGAATLAMLLTVRGHRVEVANDGLTAVAIAETLHPSLVLLDIGMPGLNGYEVCQRLRLMPCCEHATIIALTGWGQEHDRRRSAEAGFDYHIVKPVDTAMLERLVQNAPVSIGRSR